MDRKIWFCVLHCKETLNLISLLIVLCKERARNRLYRCWNFLLFLGMHGYMANLAIEAMFAFVTATWRNLSTIK